jgi:hypothetical protein
MSDPVLKILKSGETDIESTDIWRFAQHSKYPTWKIESGGTGTITIPADDTNWNYLTINHQLGYKPIFYATVDYLGKTYRIYGTQDSGITGIQNRFATNETVLSQATLIDNNNLRVGLFSGPYGPAVSTSFTVSYLIMSDEQ